MTWATNENVLYYQENLMVKKKHLKAGQFRQNFEILFNPSDLILKEKKTMLFFLINC